MTIQKSNRMQIFHTIIDNTLHFLQLFIAMYLSELLVQTPIFGGALFTAGQFWVIFIRLYGKKGIDWLPKNIRAKEIVLLIASLALNILLVVVYPSVMTRPSSLLLLLVILLFLLRQMVTDTLAARLNLLKPRHILLLLAVHLAFTGGIVLIFSVNAKDDGYGPVLVSLSIVGLILFIKQVFFPLPVVNVQPPPVSSDCMMGVSSYRIYNRMVTSVLVAINLSITMYICYLRYLPYKGFVSSLLGLLVWLVFVMGVTAVFVLLISRRTQWRYDKPTLFIVGALLWILPTILIQSGAWPLTGYNLYILGGMYGFGLACMLSIIIAMGIEMKRVVEIGLGEIDNQSYSYNTRVMIDWSVLLSSLLILFMLTLSSFIMDGKLAVVDEAFALPGIVQFIAYLLPMVCVVAALVFLALQPLDREYVRKLRVYRRQLDKGELNKPLEERLKKVLVASAPKRIGIRILKLLARPFVPLKVKGKGKVNSKDMPVVFICNHFEIYGPIAAVLRIPYYFRPWIIHKMLDREVIVDAMRNGVDTVFSFLPMSWRKYLSKIAAPLVLWIFHSLDPVPVYRADRRGVIKTMRLTVEALECNDNILLFPENPRTEKDGKYVREGVSEFYSGFVNIGKSYYKKTGKRVSFIPIYINKSKHTMTFGKSVRYDPGIPKAEEKKRILEELHRQMETLAGE